MYLALLQPVGVRSVYLPSHLASNPRSPRHLPSSSLAYFLASLLDRFVAISLNQSTPAENSTPCPLRQTLLLCLTVSLTLPWPPLPLVTRTCFRTELYCANSALSRSFQSLRCHAERYGGRGWACLTGEHAQVLFCVIHFFSLFRITTPQSRITLFCYSMERPALHGSSVPHKFSLKGCPHREHHCPRAHQTRL